ncbi:hypothetical protein M0R04_15240 [Candidatus Dojkabacteria bacterium]|jgi:hypothetical protein|nr:hypothetical protein [Candidatus Dojkabacteria bacterium]
MVRYDVKPILDSKLQSEYDVHYKLIRCNGGNAKVLGYFFDEMEATNICIALNNILLSEKPVRETYPLLHHTLILLCKVEDEICRLKEQVKKLENVVDKKLIKQLHRVFPLRSSSKLSLEHKGVEEFGWNFFVMGPLTVGAVVYFSDEDDASDFCSLLNNVYDKRSKNGKV